MASGSIKPTYEIWKNLGETPLEALSRLRTEENIPADVPMTYAGRLDPAAEGKLIILVGEECKKKNEYTALSKTYEAEILFGISTDTYDLLGLPKLDIATANTSSKKFGGKKNFFEEVFAVAAEQFLQSQIGTRTQNYPLYSSKTVGGKQLHTYAKEGNVVELPTHEVILHGYTDLSAMRRTREEILWRVKKLTEIVTGDFRQKEILTAWNALSQELPDELQSVKVTLTVSSGFYIRQLAEDLGGAFGTSACLYSLVRTRVG